MNDFFKKHGFLFCAITSLLAGAIIFLSLFGFKILNPFSIDWIFNRSFSADIAQGYLGWHYYLHSPWRFPLGTFNTLSYPVATSILNTDSIPLFAIFFKLFKFLIKDDFQYWGLYTLLCFMLQSFFGMLLVRRFTKNDLLGNITAVLSGLVFCLMPVITVMALSMPSVVCHFIFLACFIPVVYNDRFDAKLNTVFYGIVGVVAALLTPYALIISSVIVLIYCIYLYFIKKDLRQLLPFVSYILCSLITLFIIGGFVGISKYTLSEDMLYAASFNLNGFFNNENQMFFFKGLKKIEDLQAQGYAYFGMGSVFLILISSLYALLRYVTNKFNISDYKNEIRFVLILIGVSVLLAVSPRISYSNIIVGYIPYPDFLVNLWSGLKMTGRFIWIANYTILILAVCYLVKNVNRKALLIILTYCLVIQFIDFMPLYKSKGYFKEKAVQYECAFENKGTWEKMFQENDIKHIYYDKELYAESDIEKFNILYRDLNFWARNKNITFNNYYFMKPVKNIDKIYEEALKNPKEDDLFLFARPKLNRPEMRKSNLEHFYLFHEFVVGRLIPVKGWESKEISKDKL